MNWSAVAAIMSVLTFALVCAGVIWAGGKLSQKVADHSGDIERHDEHLEKHDGILGSHSEKLGRLEEWKNGFNAAANVSGGHHVERKN